MDLFNLPIDLMLGINRDMINGKKKRKLIYSGEKSLNNGVTIDLNKKLDRIDESCARPG